MEQRLMVNLRSMLTGKRPGGLGDPPISEEEMLVELEDRARAAREAEADAKTGQARAATAGSGLVNFLRGVFGYSTGAKGLGGPVLTLLLLAGLGVGGYYIYKALTKGKPKKNAGWPRGQDLAEDEEYDDKDESCPECGGMIDDDDTCLDCGEPLPDADDDRREDFHSDDR